jgi:tRNA G46 methylase TrmB
MATDWQPYAQHMLDIMEAAPGYRNLAGVGQYSPQPHFRPITKFQKRGEDKGHGVWDLIYKTATDVLQTNNAQQGCCSELISGTNVSL